MTQSGRDVTSDTARCGVVVLNWCSAPDTIACCRSLAASTYPSLLVVVVDNASPDGSFDILSDRLAAESGLGESAYVLIKTEQNLGYAGGNNRGIELCLERGCDFVLILNNDALVTESAIAEMIATARSEPRAGLIGASVVDYETGETVQCLGGASFDRWLLRTCNIAEGRSAADPQYLSQGSELFRDADYVSGACVLTSRAFLDEVGPMREDFFLYFEELDWALRGRRAGWSPAVSVTAKVRHRWTPDDPAKRATANYYFVRNGLTVLRQYHAIALVSALAAQLARSVGLLMTGRSADARSVVSGLWAFLNGRLGRRPA